MNRKQRRAAARANAPKLDPRVQSYAESYECPDCDVEETTVIRDERGLLHLHVFHDPTCPRLNGLTS